MKYVSFIVVAWLSVAPLWAQEELKHPIDQQLEDCHSIDENQTTHGMIACEEAARAAWDVELNKNYKLLMAKLTAPEQEKLRASQRQWLLYRDKELDFSGQMFYNMDGTMWLVVAAGRRTEIVRSRALELKDYYDILISGE